MADQRSAAKNTSEIKRLYHKKKLSKLEIARQLDIGKTPCSPPFGDFLLKAEKSPGAIFTGRLRLRNVAG